MARDEKKRKQERRQREHDRLQATVENLHTKGVYLKRVFRQRGINVPFYDFYDSYYEEFKKVVLDATKQFPSLIGIFEVEDKDYFGTDRSHFAPGMEQIFWRSEGEQNGYGTSNDDSNVNGYVNAFHANQGEVKTLVMIRKSVPNSKPHREFKYVLKLVALLHELGHVHDMEQQINFNHKAKTFDVIEAEVFAHLYSLKRMAEQNYYQCFTMLIDSLKKYALGSNYLRDVAKLTLERMPDYKLINVQSIPLRPLTAEDMKALGSDGRKAFGSHV